ncbi:YqaA family protein [Aliiglaciecola litoralis]|uniref:YqaA family protein n=1 Tax=Aliiglaciecola litoralis TaxID=582857 RepID=A0ABN1LF75_9ALTE
MGKLAHKTRKLIDSKHMLWSVAFASFLESTIVPIPLEAVLIPLMQAKRDKLWSIALMATLGCIAGALVGYGIGYLLFDLIGDTLVNWFSNPDQMQTVRDKIAQDGFWYVLTIGLIPVPFQIAMLAAGATGYSIWLFLLATLIARSIRYFGLAILVKVAGNQAENWFKKYKLPFMIALTFFVVIFWWWKV